MKLMPKGTRLPPMQDNIDVKAKKRATLRLFHKGRHDGMNYPPKPLPAFFSKPYREYTAYERGFFVGWELAGIKRGGNQFVLAVPYVKTKEEEAEEAKAAKSATD